MEIGENLDSLNDRAELLAYAEGYRLLALYATEKEAAVDLRKAGWIQAALAFEQNCDRIYQSLPEWARTW